MNDTMTHLTIRALGAAFHDAVSVSSRRLVEARESLSTIKQGSILEELDYLTELFNFCNQLPPMNSLVTLSVGEAVSQWQDILSKVVERDEKDTKNFKLNQVLGMVAANRDLLIEALSMSDPSRKTRRGL